MKQILLTLVALFAALTVAKAQTIDTLHVTGGNTSSTTEYVPIYGYFADYGFHSEMIYPASWIGSLAGHILTGL
ncbi:MAG: hypothetical protein IK058_04790, partial [Bacteroidales bacterium]|nr:hypothetical protein [Bacteroidales bacterium]